MNHQRALSWTIRCVAVLTCLITCSCDSSHLGAAQGENRVSSDDRFEKLLQASGATDWLALVRQSETQFQLAVVSKGGMRALDTNPPIDLPSFISSSGAVAVVSGGSTSSNSSADALFLSEDLTSLTRISEPNAGRFAASISASGTVAAMTRTGDIALRPDSTKRWSTLAIDGADLGPPEWIGDDALLTVRSPGTRRARLLRISLPSGNPPKIHSIAKVPCATSVSAAPDRTRAATYALTTPGCRSVVVGLGTTQAGVTPLPQGWHPLMWSQTAHTLVIASRDEVGSWSPGQSLISDRTSTPKELVAAVPAPVHPKPLPHE